MAEFSGGIETPAADAIAARLIASLGATTNHKAVDTFFDLPQEVQADASTQRVKQNVANASHGASFVAGENPSLSGSRLQPGSSFCMMLLVGLVREGYQPCLWLPVLLSRNGAGLGAALG